MSRTGATPKDPSKRARTNKDTTPTSIVQFVPGHQPRLPRLNDGTWNPRTLVWWEKWRNSPQSVLFMSTDWEFLLATAFIHHKFWHGDMSVAAELRLRESKFGATIEDRVKLRIQYAQANEAESKAKKKTEPLKELYGNLKAVDSTKIA